MAAFFHAMTTQKEIQLMTASQPIEEPDDPEEDTPQNAACPPIADPNAYDASDLLRHCPNGQ